MHCVVEFTLKLAKFPKLHLEALKAVLKLKFQTSTNVLLVSTATLEAFAIRLAVMSTTQVVFLISCALPLVFGKIASHDIPATNEQTADKSE